jgi:hypothetical protein
MITSKKVKLTVSVVSAGVLLAFIVSLLVHWWDDLAVLSAVLGTSLGWLFGTLLSPYESEALRFESFGKVVSAFVSGFLLSKVDAIFGVMPKNEYHDLIRSGMVIRRVLIGLTCCIIAMMAVFISRRYYHVDMPSSQS